MRFNNYIKYILYGLYGIYNFGYQILTYPILLWLAVYLNDLFIPANLMWKNNNSRIDIWGSTGAAIYESIALIAETGVLIFIIYSINKLFLKYIMRNKNYHKITNWTAKINIIICLFYIIMLVLRGIGISTFIDCI